MEGIHKELDPHELKHQPRCGHRSCGDLRTLHKHTKSMKISKSKGTHNELNPHELKHQPRHGIHKESRPQKLKHQPRCGHRSWGDVRSLHKHTRMNENE